MKSFERKLKEAYEKLRESGLDAVEIPGSKGMKLVKVGTSAALEHDAPGNVLQQIEIEMQTYLVCAS